MKTIRQQAFFRQRVLKEVAKGRAITAIARRYRISQTSIYRWQRRYNGTVESLYERSHRPKSHPKQHTVEELQLIQRVWSHNKGLGLVCLHMVLETKHGYTRSICSLNRVMKALGLGRKKQRSKKYIPKPYETPKTPGERVQISTYPENVWWQVHRSYTSTRLLMKQHGCAAESYLMNIATGIRSDFCIM